MSTSTESPALRVLAADDDLLGARLIGLFLQRLGHTATVVEGGVAAVNEARSAAFDLILLDIEMPDQDGWESLRQLREAGVTTPVIALTGHAGADHQDRCLQAGFQGYLSKPLRLNQLDDEIRRLRDGGGAPASSGLAVPSFDADALARELDVDTDTVALLLQAFMASGVNDAADLKQAVASQDAAALQHRAHRLRGSLGSLAQKALAEQATTIEQRCREGQNELAMAAAPAFLQSFDAFISAARHWLASR